MDSKIGLVIQFTGVFLVTVLLLFLRRSIKSTASGYWLAGWSALSFALFALSFGFGYPQYSQPLFGLYFFSEYVFGLMLVGGCRSLLGKKPLSKLLFVPFALIAAALAWAAADFDNIFNAHSFIISIFFITAFLSLAADERRKTFGWRVMRVALALMSLDFFHYVVLFTLRQNNIVVPLPEGYLAFNPVIDLVMEILLGFGIVIVALEGVVREMRKTNEKLTEAHAKLEMLAQTDSLTTAFNRHAFYGFLNKRGTNETTISGCVGFFDIDDLKPINDRFGHAVGDLAIRAVVRAIRRLMRAEDLIYRWGGDEFFVVMVSMDESLARARMSELEQMLTNICIEGADAPLSVGVSYGFRDFTDVLDLERAVKAADEEMYRRKQERKNARRTQLNFVPPNAEQRQEISF